MDEKTLTSQLYGPPWLHEKIAAGKLVIIDGPMGTELEARGVPMNDKAWSGPALLSHPDVVRAIHADYIAAGAEVIITTTFSTGRHALAQAGLSDEFARINKGAVDAAIQARDDSGHSHVAIAGSMCPWLDSGTTLPLQQLADEFQEQAEMLATAGVDLIALEMCSHPDYSRLIAEAAVATGLPVWLGLSCKQDTDTGVVVGFDPPYADFRQLILQLADSGASVMTLMHSTVDDTTAGLSVLQDIWQGPIGVYPESGHFVMPNWQFVDIIDPDDLVTSAHKWVENGVQILGGCCGLGVPHIQALKAAFN